MRNSSRVASALLGAGLLAALALGCAKSPDAVDPKTLKVSPKSGAQLWADNCVRCHDARAPTSYSDAQWDVVVHHMRLQANLTGPEQRAIAAFLKSAN
jgi:mono/diheme cytochrome c family protein